MFNQFLILRRIPDYMAVGETKQAVGVAASCTCKHASGCSIHVEGLIKKTCM